MECRREPGKAHRGDPYHSGAFKTGHRGGMQPYHGKQALGDPAGQQQRDAERASGALFRPAEQQEHSRLGQQRAEGLVFDRSSRGKKRLKGRRRGKKHPGGEKHTVGLSVQRQVAVLEQL